MTNNQFREEILKLIHAILNEIIANDEESKDRLIQIRYDLMALVGTIDASDNKGILSRRETI